jgi:hypothetical protein
MRRAIVITVLVAGAAIAWWFWSRSHESNSAPATRGFAVPPNSGSSQNSAASAARAGINSPDDFPLVAALNATNSTIAKDLDTISQVFDAWRTNFPHHGNPVGENADITGALTGNNPLSLVLIPRTHSAINSAGELCDRWGTPFRFHQISGARMEIQSAGPDRKFATDDDAVWTPQ